MLVRAIQEEDARPCRAELADVAHTTRAGCPSPACTLRRVCAGRAASASRSSSRRTSRIRDTIQSRLLAGSRRRPLPRTARGWHAPSRDSPARWPIVPVRYTRQDAAGASAAIAVTRARGVVRIQQVASDATSRAGAAATSDRLAACTSHPSATSFVIAARPDAATRAGDEHRGRANSVMALRLEIGPLCVLVGHARRFDRPLDAERRIVPANAAFGRRLVWCRDGVQHLACCPRASGTHARRPQVRRSTVALAADSSVPSQRPKVGEAGRTSTTTSNSRPLMQRRYLASPCGAA